MSEMIRITLPDGTARDVERGTTPADVAAAIGPGLAKAAIAARVNGEMRDIGRPIEEDADLALVTSRDVDDALELARHDYAHVLAEAVQKFDGGVVLVSHDRFFIDTCGASEVWAVEGGRVARAESFAAYKAAILRRMAVSS